jgi:hypothetical protein
MSFPLSLTPGTEDEREDAPRYPRGTAVEIGTSVLEWRKRQVKAPIRLQRGACIAGSS